MIGTEITYLKKIYKVVGLAVNDEVVVENILDVKKTQPIKNTDYRIFKAEKIYHLYANGKIWNLGHMQKSQKIEELIKQHITNNPSDMKSMGGGTYLGFRSIMMLLGKVNSSNSKNTRILDNYIDNNEAIDADTTEHNTFLSKADVTILMERAIKNN